MNKYDDTDYQTEREENSTKAFILKCQIKALEELL